MAGESIFARLIAPNLAPYKYTQALLSALDRKTWIYDSADLATLEDEDAWNKIRNDSTLAAAIEKRRRSVASISHHVKAASDDPADVLVAKAQKALFDKIKHFWRGRYNLTEAIFRGSSWSLVRGGERTLSIAGGPPMKWWVPTELEHIDRWRIRLAAGDENGGSDRSGGLPLHWELKSLTRDAWEPIPRSRLGWFITHYYERTEGDLGYGRGLLSSLYYFWRAKAIALSEGLNGLEFWARGLILAKLANRPGSTDRDGDEAAEQMREELAAHRSEHVMTLDKDDEVEVIEGGGTGHQLVTDLIKYLDEQMLRLIQAGGLTTGQGTDHGSYAHATQQGEEQDDYFFPDKLTLGEDIDDGAGALMYQANITPLRKLCAWHGLRLGSRGRFYLGSEERLEPKDALEVVKGGVPVLGQEFYERIGYTEPTEDDFKSGKVLELPQAGSGGLPAAPVDGGVPAAPADEVETDTADDPLQGEPLAPDASPEDQEASELLGKVGGITGWMEIARAVSAGELDREAAIAGMMTFFRLDREDAELLIPLPSMSDPSELAA